MDVIEKLKPLEIESLKRGIPIIGSVKGSWLLKNVKELKPKKVLELGTANGYSGIILGSEGAELVTIEIDSESAEEAEKNFRKFDINARIIIGDANEKIKELKENFDLVYIDHNKSGYMKVLEECLRLPNKKGVMIADNIFFEGCADFRNAVLKDKRLKTEIINVGDGLSYSVILDK